MGKHDEDPEARTADADAGGPESEPNTTEGKIDTVDTVDTVEVEWDDQKWRVPADVDDWPFEASVALEAGKAMLFVTHLLGPAQMRLFHQGRRTKPRTARDGAKLMKAIMVQAYGAPAGE